MQLCKLVGSDGSPRVGLVDGEQIRLLSAAATTLAELLHAANPRQAITSAFSAATATVPFADAKLLPPIDRQEVWAAGVTYQRSQKARMEESAGAASFYDKVYTADRPELFFKANPHRVVGPGQPVRIRTDTAWSVPEPEFTLVLSPQLRIVGYTIGNDMSARDIEGENPLYLPQAKCYNQCAALGPVVTLADAITELPKVGIALAISRGGRDVFGGTTSLKSLNRTFEELVGWLGRDNSFPDGAFLMTGTGIVPPDDFTLAAGDEIRITVDGIGTLANPVVQG